MNMSGKSLSLTNFLHHPNLPGRTHYAPASLNTIFPTVMRIHILLSFGFTLLSTILFAQMHDNVWLFGGDGGDTSPATDSGGVTILRFDQPEWPTIQNLQTPKVFFYVTNASISDSIGNLSCYTNGEHIYSHNHNIMANGNKIASNIDGYGYVLPQGAIGLPLQGQSGQYLLLSIERHPGSVAFGWNLFSHVIDMTMNNGLGQVTTKRQLLVQDSLAFGKISAVRHANGRDWWFVAPRDFSNIYYIGLISSKGIQLDTCVVGDVVLDGLGQAAFSPDGSKFVRVDDKSSLTTNQISLFDFDRCTGKLSNYRTHFPSDLNTFGIGCAFSKDSKYLYVNNTNSCYQYDLEAADIFSSETVVAEWDGTYYYIWPTNFYLSQLAPDGRIYINTNNGSTSLHTIKFPNRNGVSCQFIQNAILTPTLIILEMPNFPNYRLGPLDGSPCDTLGLDNHPLARWRWEQEDTLQPLQITFTDLSDYEPSEWFWTFGDGYSSTEQYPVHTFDRDSVYEVCLVVRNANSADTLCRMLALGVSAHHHPEDSPAIQVAPNPFRDRIVVANTRDHKLPVFRLYDATGRLVKTAELPFGYAEIATQELSAGIYYWRVESAGGVTEEGKLVKIW